MMTDRAEQVESEGRSGKRQGGKNLFRMPASLTRYMKLHHHRQKRTGDLKAPTETDGIKSDLLTQPPKPPFLATPATATDPCTDPETLWLIARQEPELRRWLVANPSASASLLETVSQLGGPGVRRALEILLDIPHK